MSDIIVLTLWAKLLKRLKYWEQFLQLSGTSLSNKESSMSNRQSNPVSWKYKALSSVFSRMVATTTRTSRTLHSNRQILQREKHVLHEVHPLTTFIQLILNQFFHEHVVGDAGCWRIWAGWEVCGNFPCRASSIQGSGLYWLGKLFVLLEVSQSWIIKPSGTFPGFCWGVAW